MVRLNMINKYFLLCFSLLLIFGCQTIQSTVDTSSSDTYDEDFDYSIYSKPTLLQGDYDDSELLSSQIFYELRDTHILAPLAKSDVEYEFPIGPDDIGKEFFYLIQSNCGYDINALSIDSGSVRKVSSCHSPFFQDTSDYIQVSMTLLKADIKYDDPRGVDRSGKKYSYLVKSECGYDYKEYSTETGTITNLNPCAAEYVNIPQDIMFSFTVGQNKLAYFSLPPNITYPRKSSELSPSALYTVVDLNSGERKNIDFKIETDKRERGSILHRFQFSPDFEYFFGVFNSNFRNCYGIFNQGERCTQDENIIIGRTDENNPHLIFSLTHRNHSPRIMLFEDLKWTLDNDIIFTIDGKKYISKNLFNE